MKYIKLYEEYDDSGCYSGGVAYGNSNIGGMGSIVSAQPSTMAGATIGSAWADNMGTQGSGDVSNPYNASGGKMMFQKQPAFGKNHGPQTGKKSREKKLDMKRLKDIFSKRQDYTSGEGGVKSDRKKVMSFSDFSKEKMNTVTHLKN